MTIDSDPDHPKGTHSKTSAIGELNSPLVDTLQLNKSNGTYLVWKLSLPCVKHNVIFYLYHLEVLGIALEA